MALALYGISRFEIERQNAAKNNVYSINTL